MKSAREHLDCFTRLHKFQHASGRYLLHEHPLSARSWNNLNMHALTNFLGIIKVHAQMCELGMKLIKRDGASA